MSKKKSKPRDMSRTERPTNHNTKKYAHIFDSWVRSKTPPRVNAHGTG